jgi:putative NADPH-quinone reductase
MRALVIYCHPSLESFTAAVLCVIRERLKAAEAETRIIDLYQQGFDPVMTQSAWQSYECTSDYIPPIKDHIAALSWCDALIFVYPTWWYGQPAMLKGWLDRVLAPGVAFEMPEQGDIKPALTHISRLGVFTTCGASPWLTWFIGSPGKRTLLRGIRLLCAKRCRTAFSAHYNMDSSTEASRAAHLRRVAQTVDRLVV